MGAWGLVQVVTYRQGDSFGELALMYNAPRAASVIAKGDCQLWALDRLTFKVILMDTTGDKRRRYEAFLSRVRCGVAAPQPVPSLRVYPPHVECSALMMASPSLGPQLQPRALTVQLQGACPTPLTPYHPRRRCSVLLDRVCSGGARNCVLCACCVVRCTYGMSLPRSLCWPPCPTMSD
jgi:hypothetical protein